MIEIFKGTFNEISIIKNLLEINNIEVFVNNEFMSTIEPWALSSGGYKPVILKVSDKNYKEANEIIENFTKGNLSL
jgi:hypothetical protein